MDENPAAMFNELNSLAHEILSNVKKDIEHNDTELAETRQVLSNAWRELDDLKKTRQDLSEELAKSQEARRNLESERDYLHGEISRLNDSYQNLAASLREAQAESRNYKSEVITLRGKIAQVQKFLAG